MQITMTGHHVEITGALRAYVQEKLERIERHFDNATHAHVILSVEKLRQTAEISLHVAGNDLHANATHEDMYAAIDAVTDKIDRQVKKHKEKRTDHHRSEKVKSFS